MPPQAPEASAPAALAAADAERVRKALSSALAENTRRAYLGHWAAFGAWCGQHGYAPAPARNGPWPGWSGKTPRRSGRPAPWAWRSWRRSRRPPASRAPGGSQGAPNPRKGPAERGLADSALCAVLFYAGLRRSEAAALAWGDIEASADGTGLLAVRRSKTDPEAEGSVRYLPREAVRALEAIRPEDAGPEDPVFGLSGRQVGRRVAAAALGAGLGEGFSGHSGRVGLAAELSRAGASTHEIAAAGGWQSAGMVIRYTRRETAKRGAVARYLEDRQDLPG